MATSPDEAPPSAQSLHSFGGREAPPELVRELRLLVGFPPKALSGLWRALGPCLAEGPASAGGAAAIEERLEALTRESGVSTAEIAGVVRSARSLFREAARRGVDRQLFARDLEVIFNGEGEGEREASIALLAGFEPAMEGLRAEIIEGTLADHGKLLVGVDWRVDTLSTSSRGSRLRTPIVMLTLRYKDGDRTERITLQAMPAALDELRKVIDEILD